MFLILPLNGGLDINGVAGTLQLGAHGGHTDDLLHERMVAFFSVGPLFSVLWSYGEYLSFGVTAEPDCTVARIHRLGY